MVNQEDRNNYAAVIEDIAFDLKFGEDTKKIAESLRAMADEIDPKTRRKR